MPCTPGSRAENWVILKLLIVMAIAMQTKRYRLLLLKISKKEATNVLSIRKILMSVAALAFAALALSPSYAADKRLSQLSSAAIETQIAGLSDPDAKFGLDQAAKQSSITVQDIAKDSGLGDQGRSRIVQASYSCSTYCSTGCSTGCSSGCSSGCSYGCRIR